LLKNSRLIEEREVEKLAEAFQEGCRNRGHLIETKSFCDFLISTNRLTQWQCDKLLTGRWKGFYLGDYVLLEHIGKDYETTWYKARELRNGRFVRLVVSPFNQRVGRNEYSVEPFEE
jgi:eukaryotic-like serine/threonine-protein kinase